MPNDSSLKAFLSSLSPEDVATLFTGLRNTLPTGMAVYSPELNAGEAEVIAKRQAEREAARVREMEILTRLLPQAMAKRQAAIPESGADPFVPTRPRIMKESPFMFTQPRATPVPQQYAEGGPVTPDHTQPDMSDGGQMISDPNLYAGGGSVLKSALGLAERPAKTNIRSLIEKVRNEEGAFEARRLERAADEVPNLESMYREGALERLFGGDNARALMTMRPGDFEKYAAPLKPRSSFVSGSGPKKENMSTDEYVRYLSGVNKFHDVPFLEIDKKMQGSTSLPFIVGHEGRHRNRALAERGEQAGLVQLLPRSQLREPFPRRDREDYLEALRQELGLTGGMVRPESYFDDMLGDNVKRGAIKLPEPYAQGGSVQAFSGGGKALGKKSLDEMQAELLSKEGLSRRALFGLKPDYPLAKTPEPLSKVEQEVKRAEQAARSQGQAPSVTASRVDVDPGTGSKKSLMQSVTETPVSRRTVLKTAGSQVAQNVLPMGDLMKLAGAPAVTSPVGAIAQAARVAPALPVTMESVMAGAIGQGMRKREAINEALRKFPGQDFDDAEDVYRTLKDPYRYINFDSSDIDMVEAARPADTMRGFIGAPSESPLFSMRPYMRALKQASPEVYGRARTYSKDTAESALEDLIDRGLLRSEDEIKRFLRNDPEIYEIMGSR